MGVKSLKIIAEDFLNLCAKGDSREAFRLYADKNFKHHNVYFKGDADTIMIAMEESAKENPDKIFEIKRSLEDGDLVAVHSHIRQTPSELGYAVMHIFKFNESKIVEMWDFGQEVPSEMINENGMF